MQPFSGGEGHGLGLVFPCPSGLSSIGDRFFGSLRVYRGTVGDVVLVSEGPEWAAYWMTCPPKLRDFRGQYVYALLGVVSKHEIHALEFGLPLRRWWQSLGSGCGERH